MAAIKLLLSEARRHNLFRPHSNLHISPFLNRSLCSSSSPFESDPTPPAATESPRRPTGTVSIQTVSYAPKPKDESSPDQDPPQPSPTTPPQSQQQPRRPRDSLSQRWDETRPVWTREDIRYVKDAPTISPVSYPTRVAPLPEDKVPAEAAGSDSKESEELEKETKRIDAESRMRRRVFRVVEEDKVAAPFPMLIKVEKKERKPILDLTEAIRQVKVSVNSQFRLVSEKLR